MTPLTITHFTQTNALGKGVQASLNALQSRRSGLTPCDFEDAQLETWIGRVAGLEESPLPEAFAEFECRNNRLARLALEQDGFAGRVAELIGHYGAARIGLFIGTSTSGIRATETAYRQRDRDTDRLPDDYLPSHTHNIFSPTWFIRRYLGLEGPALAISTACSSSAKVFAAAHRQIEAGLCDAALVGGVDSLCLTTLYGFNALDLISASPCRPWDLHRDGINIGEGAGFALLEPSRTDIPGERLLGYGESCDAFHMSTPHPEGQGAALAMRQALERAGLGTQDIDYVNLHGTSTPSNDAAEDKAVVAMLGDQVPCSSTKGWTGHTLGAAGITEALFALLCLRHGFIPGSLQTREIDPSLQARIERENRPARLNQVLSNSFGFGGNNCSLLFGRSP
ncbi:MAG: beta-ketoacyl-[acyl-carrier-protein] synthase family protein [Gammaproteobacteria bacterium]|nr:beta-ketoacyl-[acyl-carrier-protein] synthase family protein [Gammaproteobacteria bacterium]